MQTDSAGVAWGKEKGGGVLAGGREGRGGNAYGRNLDRKKTIENTAFCQGNVGREEGRILGRGVEIIDEIGEKS